MKSPCQIYHTANVNRSEMPSGIWARNLVFMATEYEEVTLTLEDGNTLSSEEMILRTLKEIINKWVSDITCFGICSLDKCNAKEIENKLIFEEAERKRNIPSSSSINNVCSNSSVTSHDNVNVMSNNNNARKRAARMELKYRREQ
ncbi:hypothetical protein AVEN_86738-1 [Araneus ventricosus]|uniref:Uncharacterized protein n=1 Tax=Araneus ventricosus TaxID=182803 RepID=A0A4Y2JHG7_ARAVE|nr:hypothetical protein AVEN_86738-1 [Araneus ventricosus]